jgi:hypothetical protein
MKSTRDTKKAVMGSIDAYLRGDENLNWIVRYIRSSGLIKSVLQELFSAYRKTYAENTRFQELEKACKQEKFL